MKAVTDELQDVKAENSVFREKTYRLNVELNHVLGNHGARIIDVDALCMENRQVGLRVRREVHRASSNENPCLCDSYGLVSIYLFYFIFSCAEIGFQHN